MKDMKNSPILKTGDIFRAKDKLGNVYCYEFEGFDLGDLDISIHPPRGGWDFQP